MTAEKVDYAARVREIVPDLEYTAEFVPWSLSRSAGEKHPSLNWKITVKRNRIRLTTDYTQGCGHCAAYKASVKELGHQDSISRADELRKECETGTQYGAGLRRKKVSPPTLADVLHSLLLDASAIDCGSFEAWCDEGGSDPDSRKAEACYKACVEIGLTLRAMLGEEKISALRDALQDF